MKVVVAAVVSLDGKLTRHDDPDVSSWASKEDHEHFTALVSSSPVIVMGSGTYEVMKDNLELSPDKLRVVLTSKPADYQDRVVNGQLEFQQSNPKEFISDIEKRGFNEVLVAGGEKMITDFLESGVVTEIYLTIEPRIFGEGKSFVANALLDVKLKLIEQKTLNSNGSQLLHYEVLRD